MTKATAWRLPDNTMGPVFRVQIDETVFDVQGLEFDDGRYDVLTYRLDSGAYSSEARSIALPEHEVTRLASEAIAAATDYGQPARKEPTP